MDPNTHVPPPASFSDRFQRRPAFWGAMAGSLAGMIVGLALGVAFVAQADNNRRTADVADGPLLIPYDGFLMLNNGAVDGEESLTFRLYGGPTCTDCELWNETQTVQIHSGRFSVGLGTATSLDAVILDAEKLYLGIEVNGTPLSGRQAIEPVPYAAWSGHGTEFKTYSIATPGGLTTETLDVQAQVNVQGSQLTLGTNDGRPQGSALTQRALVHSQTGDQLWINALGDFEGGTLIDSNLEVDGTLATAGSVDINGSELRLGSGNDRLASYASNRLTLNPGGDAPTGVLIDSRLDVNGNVNVVSSGQISTDRIRGINSLYLHGSASASESMRILSGGQVSFSHSGGVSVSGPLSVSSESTYANDLRFTSASAGNREIRNVDNIRGDGSLILYPADASSNQATLGSDGTFTASTLSASSVEVTGSKVETFAGDSNYSISTFFNSNWADCGDKPVTGVRLSQYTSGSDRRARLVVRCGP